MTVEFSFDIEDKNVQGQMFKLDEQRKKRKDGQRERERVDEKNIDSFI